MISVKFENSDGEEREIARVNREGEVLKAIRDFCDERAFTIHYTRSWESDGRRKYDVGSHTEFFYAEEVADDARE